MDALASSEILVAAAQDDQTIPRVRETQCPPLPKLLNLMLLVAVQSRQWNLVPLILSLPRRLASGNPRLASICAFSPTLQTIHMLMMMTVPAFESIIPVAKLNIKRASPYVLFLNQAKQGDIKATSKLLHSVMSSGKFQVPRMKI